MTFKDWLCRQPLSAASIQKYDTAISGVMSSWAIDNGLIDQPLTTIRDIDQFLSVVQAIKELSIYQERNNRGKNMYGSALNKYAKFLHEELGSSKDKAEANIETSLEKDLNDILVTTEIDTDAYQLLKTRIGQGQFRQQLISYWGGCAVTHYKDTRLLIASHIKPWRVASHPERLDLYNGLLLLPSLDRVFDAGLVTFEYTGAIRLSPLLQTPNILGIHDNMRVNLTPHHQKYMDYHRGEVFYTK
ncbi:MAG: HNH endonuclease [Pseudomonadales bacterium]